jgi:hypothetical protein
MVAALGLCASASPVSATPVEITFTGTLFNTDANGNPYPFPWGYASNTVPATSFYSVAGDSYVAKFRFDTSVGAITSVGGGYTLSGPSSILLSGDIYVGGHDFQVPLSAFSPSNFNGKTTLAEYVRYDNFIEVLLYEDTSASAGLVLQASTTTPWGANLTG